eukprot:Gb_09154 [translate_table: standard]
MMKMTNNYGNGTKHRQKFKSHHLDTGRGGGVTILMVVLVACLAWLYVAGRLWQDAENRNLLFNLLEKNSGQMPKAVSVEEQLLNLGCKDLGKKIAEVETELALARSQGYLHKRSTWNATVSNQRLLAVIGIYTGFGSHLNRNRIRNTWLPTGKAWMLHSCKNLRLTTLIYLLWASVYGLWPNTFRLSESFILLAIHEQLADGEQQKK